MKRICFIFLANVFAFLFAGCTSPVARLEEYSDEELLILRESLAAGLQNFDREPYAFIGRIDRPTPHPNVFEIVTNQFFRVDQNEPFRLLYVTVDDEGGERQYYFQGGVLYIHDRATDDREKRETELGELYFFHDIERLIYNSVRLIDDRYIIEAEVYSAPIYMFRDDRETFVIYSFDMGAVNEDNIFETEYEWISVRVNFDPENNRALRFEVNFSDGRSYRYINMRGRTFRSGNLVFPDEGELAKMGLE